LKREPSQVRGRQHTTERRHIFGDMGWYVLVRNIVIADGIMADSKKMMEKI
jgi:hypothetical protein